MTAVLVEPELEEPAGTVFFCGARVAARFYDGPVLGVVVTDHGRTPRGKPWLSARGICRVFGLDEEAELRGLRLRACAKQSVRQASLERGPGTTWRVVLGEHEDIFLPPSSYTNWLLGAVAGHDPEGRFARRLAAFQEAYFDQLFGATVRQRSRESSAFFWDYLGGLRGTGRGR